MMIKCRYPGCDSYFCTQQGVELHEHTHHGYVYNHMLQSMMAQMRTENMISEIDQSIKDQIAFQQDVLFINGSLKR
jgi:hypothetical protein